MIKIEMVVTKMKNTMRRLYIGKEKISKFEYVLLEISQIEIQRLKKKKKIWG